MIVTYLGKQFVKIQKGDYVIALNPISKDSSFSAKSKFGSNLAMSTTNHPNFNGFEMVSYGENKPFVIDGPGDYEVKDIFIKGTETKTVIEKKEYINTVYSFNLEGISVCMLGAVSSESISNSFINKIEEPDILFVSLNGLLTPSEAYKIGVRLNAKLIIPMDYDSKSIKTFLKEGGKDDLKPIDKLTIKAKDLSGREGEIVILNN
ncbi:MAG: MBL fold metallo-hydrolase [Patescibacteria group bacterium]|nr:MBL fold metallo-hydrolase [Patescibacteria group bacterium]